MPLTTPADLVCSHCRTANADTRHFCRRCGEPLRTEARPAEFIAEPSWWRRSWGRLRRSEPVGGPAGTRPDGPDRSGGGAAFGRLLTVLLTGGLLSYAFAPPVQGWVNDRLTGVAGVEQAAVAGRPIPVRPTTIDASEWVPSDPALSAIDGQTTTFWAAPRGDTKPVLTLSFGRPVTVSEAIVRLGGTADLQAWSRPSVLRVSYTDGTSEDVRVADTLDAQPVRLAGKAATTAMTVQVVDVYRSPTNSGVAISEIELFGPPPRTAA